MKKNLTILCEDQYQQKRGFIHQTQKNQRKSISPYSKTNKNFNFTNSTTCQTPQAKQSSKISCQFKSPKYVGIIQKNVLQRLKYYEQKHKNQLQTQSVSTKVKEQQIAIRQLRQKPQINQISKELFEKIIKQRKLSPNILQRFQTYECEKVSKTAKYDLLKAQGLQVKNTTFTCRKNMNQKIRSPLQQCSMNPNRSKSKSATNLQKCTRNPSNIGRIVQRKKPDQYQSKNFPKTNPQQKQIYYSLMANNKNEKINKQFMTRQNISPTQKMNQIKERYQTDTNDFRQITPISIKKNNLNGKKWKVIL